MNLPYVAIIGRPNVGKSSLFNVLAGFKKAIVSKTAGTTRDALYAVCKTGRKSFLLVDTAGLEARYRDLDEIELSAQEQVRNTLTMADVLLFLVDGSTGILPADKELIRLIRKAGKKIILIISKCDNEKIKNNFYDEGLGVKDLIFISNTQLQGHDELLLMIKKKIPQVKYKEEDGIKIAIIGRPNVGKSSIINSLLGEKRAIVSDIAGTTRDTNDASLKYQDQSFTLIDTAGIRRRGKIERGIERYSVAHVVYAVARADVVVLVFDISEGVTKQDMHIAKIVRDAGTGVVLVANKWDLIKKDAHTMNEFKKEIQYSFKFFAFAELVFTSAIQNKRLTNILDMSMKIMKERVKKITTGELNRFLMRTKIKHQPSAKSKRFKPPKFYYLTQTAINPPEFTFFVNQSKAIHPSYMRYIENSLREEFGFRGTVMRLHLRDKNE